MNREDIIRMAREAGFEPEVFDEGQLLEYREEWHATLERFAQLIAAAEREACAKVCEELVIEVVGNSALAIDQCSRAIRARGQQ